MRFITTAAQGRGFAERGGDSAYVPYGCNYFDPLTGWAPKIWRQFREESVRGHFERMQELGVNTVRMFLSIASFMTESGELNPDGMAKADAVLSIAKTHGIRVEFSGPDFWEGVPDWVAKYFNGEENAYFLDDEWVGRLERFWSLFAAHYRDEPALFSYDLLNEPWLKWDSPLLRRLWGDAPPAMEQCPLDGSRNEEFLAFRERLIEKWTETMTQAIRGSDPNHMVTIGFHQLSMPHQPHFRYTLPGFSGKKLTRHLDYAALHWYPYSPEEHVQPHRKEDDIEPNIGMILASIRNGRAGKPVSLEEFGWYGGGPVYSWGRDMPHVDEEVQVNYLRRVVEATLDEADGWLTWGYADVPDARDATRRSGLVDERGAVKLWGRVFCELKGRVLASREGQKTK